MFKFILVFRGGVNDNVKEKVEEAISSVGEQDNFFITDVKTHSIEMIMDHDQVGPFVSRVQGTLNRSYIKSNYLGDDRSTFVMVLGKLQDGGVMKAMQGQVQGLFK